MRSNYEYGNPHTVPVACRFCRCRCRLSSPRPHVSNEVPIFRGRLQGAGRARLFRIKGVGQPGDGKWRRGSICEGKATLPWAANGTLLRSGQCCPMPLLGVVSCCCCCCFVRATNPIRTTNANQPTEYYASLILRRKKAKKDIEGELVCVKKPKLGFFFHTTHTSQRV